MLCLLQSAREQNKSSLRFVLLVSVLFSVATTCIPFFWIFATIHRYTGQNYVLTLGLALAYAGLFQLKFALVFALIRALRLIREPSFIGMLAIAAVVAIGDALAPELFPWSWGNAIAAEPHLRELAAIGSVYALSFFAAFIAIVILVATRSGDWRYSPAMSTFKAPVIFITVVLCICAALRFWPAMATESPLRVAVVQTNIGAAAAVKQGDVDFATDAINRLFNQSTDALQLFSPLDLLIWGEGSMPFHSAALDTKNREIYSPTLDGVLEYLRRRMGVAVIFQDLYFHDGVLASRFSVRGASAVQSENQYLKRRLVPWGEYLPLETELPAIRRWFPEAGRFTAAHESSEIAITLPLERAIPVTRTTVAAETGWLQDAQKIRSTIPLAPPGRQVVVKPLLCYEALFPADAQIKQADLIVNLASDAWFGDGIEGAQHASATMLRAVENGVPMIRAAMSGISFAVDYHGNQIVPRTGQGRAEILTAEVPLQKRRTLFSRFGMLVFYALVFAALWPWLMQRFLDSGTRESK